MRNIPIDMPDINKRIMEIIEDRTDGNVRKFASKLMIGDTVKINRLFNRDKRNNLYPLPSVEILMAICTTYNVSSDWILFGKEYHKKTVNNINIEKNGGRNNNIATKGSTINASNEDMLSVIKTQQEQLNKLIELSINGRK